MVSDSRMTRTFLAVFLSLLYAVPVHGRQAPPRAWVIATYAYPQRDRVAAIQPLADYLGVRARHPVQVRLFDSPTALVDALRRGEVDVAVPNLHGYLQARRASEPLTTLPVPQVPALQADRYRAVLVGRQELEAPGELERQARTLRLVLVGRDSASGGFVPVRELRRRGLEPTTAFDHLAYAVSHAAALESVASGRADVAALAADVYDASRPTGVVEVWRSQPIPPGPAPVPSCRRRTLPAVHRLAARSARRGSGRDGGAAGGLAGVRRCDGLRPRAYCIADARAARLNTRRHPVVV